MEREINVNEWNSEETFSHMECFMVNVFPNEHSLIQKVITTSYKPTEKEITEALSLDLFGFIPK